MSVNYDEAMQTLTSMFASVDKEIIDAVLRANDMRMERTIDALLSMSDASGTPSLDPPLPPLSDPIVDTPIINPQQMESDEMLARALQNELFLAGEERANPEHTTPQPAFDNDLSLKEVKDKFSQLGEAAKSKLRDLGTMFFKKDDKSLVEMDSPMASPTLTHIRSLVDETSVDDEEIVAFDRRIARRRAQAIMEDDDEEEGGLVDRRPHRVAHVGPDQ